MREADPFVFVSYARPDIDGARAIVELLADAGVRTWFDKKDLMGGQNWRYVIRQGIGEAALVLVCLSKRAANRKGFFYREMRYAVSEAMKMPKGKVYVIPSRLDDCDIPDDLRHWQAVDLFAASGSSDLLRSIGDALDSGIRARSGAHDTFARAIAELNAVALELPSVGSSFEPFYSVGPGDNANWALVFRILNSGSLDLTIRRAVYFLDPAKRVPILADAKRSQAHPLGFEVKFGKQWKLLECSLKPGEEAISYVPLLSMATASELPQGTRGSLLLEYVVDGRAVQHRTSL